MDLVTQGYMAWQAFSRGHGSGSQRLLREPGLAAAGNTKVRYIVRLNVSPHFPPT